MLGAVRTPPDQLRRTHPERAPLTFEDVYTAHSAFVFRVLRGMGVPDAQVDDAVQEVFLVVHRRLGEFTGQARVTTWLFEIALRVASHQRRKHKRARDHTPISDALTCHEQSPFEHAEANQRLTQLQTALAMLDEEKRATFILAEIEGMTAPEIASLTGTPLNTVYTRLRRARASFSAFWQARREP